MPNLLKTVLIGQKLILLIFVLLFCFAGCVSPEVTLPSPKYSSSSEEITKQMWMTTDRLNRRTCPNEKCGSVGQLFFREGAQVHEQKGAWVRITKYYGASCKNGKSEYVDSGNAACGEENGIKDGQFAEWVTVAHLSETQPADPAANATGAYLLIKGSDDYQKYKDVFARTAQSLISSGTCSEADFQEMGGFLKSTTHKDQPIYFTYCGGMSPENRIYLDASTGSIFK